VLGQPVFTPGDIGGKHNPLRLADEIFHRQQPDAGIAEPAVEGIVAVVAHHEEIIVRDDDRAIFVTRAIVGALNNFMRRAARQRLVEQTDQGDAARMLAIAIGFFIVALRQRAIDV